MSTSDGFRYIHQLKLIPENVELERLNIGDLVTFQGNECEVVANKFNKLNERGSVVLRHNRDVATLPYSSWQHQCLRRHAVPILLPVTEPLDSETIQHMQQTLSNV